MASQQETWFRRRRPLPLWPAAVAIVVVLGIWGFAQYKIQTPGGRRVTELTPVDMVYRTVRLFALEFDRPPGNAASWQLWVAAFAAPLLTLRGIARLFQEQVGGIITHYFVRPRMVVFGANERSAALVAAASRPGRWRDAIVVVDPDPAALSAMTAPRVWTVRGHGTNASSLRQLAVSRAANLIIVTGDNARNSAITTAVLDLKPTPDLDLYVEVEEVGLARTLEQGGHRVGMETVPFSAPAIGVTAVLDELEDERGRAGHPSLLAAEPTGMGPTLAVFGRGRLVEAFVLELHRRRQVQLLEDSAASAAVPRVLLLGPGATQHRRTLTSLLGTDVQLLDLDSFDVRLDQIVELDIETARHLTRSGRIREVFVLAPSDLDGGGIAITLARHLGPSAQLVLVTESGSTPFGDEIQEQTHESPALARVRLFRIPERAYTLPALQAERIRDRLGRALYTSDPLRGPGGWDGLSEQEREVQRRRAAQRLVAADAGAIPLRRSALVAPSPAEIPLLTALGFDQPTALARAGLRADFQNLTVLIPSAQRLLASHDAAAFTAWCEVARLHPGAARLDELARTIQQPVQQPVQQPGQQPGSGPDAADVLELLLVRRAILGDPQALAGLTPPVVPPVVLPPDGANPDGAGPHAHTVVLLGGPADDLALLDLLEPALSDPVGDVDLRAVMPDGPLREQLTLRGARTAGAGAGAVAGAGAGAGANATRAELLGIWREVVAAGASTGLRVIALPGANTEDVLLSRALGATIGRIEADGAPNLSQALLNGAAGVVPVPPDRMTVRAFLRPARWPAGLHELREPIAAELHRRYVARQRSRKVQEDPALLPWPELSPWLQRSNLAVVDDIPAKLAMLGLRLDGTRSGTGPDLARLVNDQVELLAELEHGRYTAERLLSGWTMGVRDPARFLTPHLQAWAQLDDPAKEYDREIMRDLPSLLAAHRLTVTSLPSRPQ